MESNQVTIDLATKPLSEIDDEVQQVAGPEVAAQVTLCTAILRAGEAISAGQTKGETQ